VNNQPVVLLDRSAVDRLLGAFDVVDAVENILRQKFHKRIQLPSEATLYWSTADDRTARSIGMPGGLVDWSAYGMKVINSSLANTAKGIPRASGLVLLFDAETARIQAVIEAARISALRTALVSLVGAQRLANLQPLRLGLIGCGPIGVAHLEIFLTNLSVEHLYLYDRDEKVVAQIAARVSNWGYRGKIEVVQSVPALFSNANCIVMATTVTESYIGCDIIRAGQTLINVSLDDLDEDVFYAADQIWVDDLELVFDDKRRRLGKILRAEQAEHRNRAINLRGSIDELVASDRVARKHIDEIVIFNPFGMSILDVGIASLVFKQALAQNSGDLFDFAA